MCWVGASLGYALTQRYLIAHARAQQPQAPMLSSMATRCQRQRGGQRVEDFGLKLGSDTWLALP
jgi:hypothetical protein